MIVRRYDQRTTSDRSSAYAALISSISECDRAKYVSNSMTSSRNSHHRDEEVRRKVWENSRRREDHCSEKLMPESLLNYRLRGTTLPYEELLIALENITIDKVTRHSVSKVRKMDTSAPLEIGGSVRRRVRKNI